MNKKTKPTKEQENPLKEIEELLDKQNENLRELMKTIETINTINNLFLQTDNQLGKPSQEEKERREKELGAVYNGTSYINFFDGLIDEVRISNVARSAAWIKASYNSLNNSLLTYGAREEHCWEDTLIFDLWGIKRHPNFSIEKMAEIMKEELSGDEIKELVLRLIS